MGFLHKLWDETLAGPAPETGLGKLRKYDSFNGTSSRSSPPLEEIAISRSITILRTHNNLKKLAVDSDGSSSAGSTSPSTPTSAPTTPFSQGSPRAEFRRLMRHRTSAEPLQSSESTRSGWDV